MKKIEYQAPEMEIVELQAMTTLLAGSINDGTNPGLGGDGEPGVDIPD